MKTRRIIILSLYFLLFVFSFIASNLAVKKDRKDLGARYYLQINPLPPEAIKLFAGEFKGLMADYILLEIGSFMGGNRRISQDQWKKVCLGFKQAQRLDPYFQQTYLLAQGFLPWGAKKPDTAVKILDVSRKHRPWDWRPGYYMGFDYYYFLNDYSRASESFLEAARVKNAPLLLAVLGGRLALKGKRAEAAVLMLKNMLNDPALDDKSRQEISDRVEALEGVLLMEKAIKQYRLRYGDYPPSLKILIEKGLLAEMPKNPYSDRYYYSSENGEVYFDEIR